MPDILSVLSWPQQWHKLIVAQGPELVSPVDGDPLRVEHPGGTRGDSAQATLPEAWLQEESIRRHSLNARLDAERRWGQSILAMPIDTEEVLSSLLDWARAMQRGDLAEQRQEEMEVEFTRSQNGAAHRIRATADYAASAQQLKTRSSELVTRTQRVRSATIGHVTWLDGVSGLEPQPIVASETLLVELSAIEQELLATPNNTQRQRGLNLVRTARLQIEKWQTVFLAAISESSIGSEWLSAREARARRGAQSVKESAGKMSPLVRERARAR